MKNRKTQFRQIVELEAPYVPEDEGIDILWATGQLFCPHKVGDRIEGTEITNIRLERLQDISEEDAIAEGIYQMTSGYWCGATHPIKKTPKHLPSAIEGFRSKWESINGAESWSQNPWVWVVELEKL
jgi:hypothetical protein